MADGLVHTSIRHDSAGRHVAGRAAYIDDLPEAQDLLHVVMGMSERAHARILSMDLTAVLCQEGDRCKGDPQLEENTHRAVTQHVAKMHNRRLGRPFP